MESNGESIISKVVSTNNISSRETRAATVRTVGYDINRWIFQFKNEISCLNIFDYFAIDISIRMCQLIKV